MLIMIVRSIIMYTLVMLCMRMMGKRQVGQLEPSEFVVAMLLADLAAIPMQDSSLPLLSGVVPIATVVGLELVLSFFVMKSVVFRKFLCGKPVILIDNGKILQENLRRTRYTLDELTSHLRQKDVLDLEAVQYAILETDGNLSVFPYPEEKPASANDAGITPKKQSLPITIIQDGYLSREDLKRAGRDMFWLKKVLGKHKSREETTLLLTVDGEGKILWIGKEESSRAGT